MAAGLLYGASILSDCITWTFHHLVGTAGHARENDKPTDLAFRRIALALCGLLLLALHVGFACWRHAHCLNAMHAVKRAMLVVLYGQE